MTYAMKAREITRDEFFKLNEDDLMFITCPGRMGDEDGTSFVIKRDDEYLCYRIDGWMYGPKDRENYISIDETFEVFPEWKKTWYEEDENKKNDGKYIYIYMGYGNALCVDKRIFDKYEPFLMEEVNKKKTSTKTNEIDPSLYYNLWDTALMKMIEEEHKIDPAPYTILEALVLSDYDEPILYKIGKKGVVARTCKDYRKVVNEVPVIIIDGKVNVDPSLFNNKYVLCINNDLKIGTRRCHIKTNKKEESKEIIEDIIRSTFYTSVVTYSLYDLVCDRVGNYKYISFDIDELKDMNKIINIIPQNNQARMHISMDINMNTCLFDIDDIFTKLQKNLIYNGKFTFSCPMYDEDKHKIRFYYEQIDGLEKINFRLMGYKVKINLKNGKTTKGLFKDYIKRGNKIKINNKLIGCDEIEKMESLEDISVKEYTYVSVVYCDDFIANTIEEPSFYYKTDRDDISTGDIVLVDRMGKEVLAKVIRVEYYYEENAPFPLEKTKDIIKKIDKYKFYRCPICGNELVKIIYGLSNLDAHEAEQKGVMLGGCVFFKDSPAYHCKKCNKNFSNDLKQCCD